MEHLKKYRFLLRFAAKVLVLCGAFWAIFTFAIEPHRMGGNMMFPAVRDGDLGIFYKPERPYVGEVILYEADGGLHIGRVAAYGGQVVDFPEGGGYTVNGYAPAEEVAYQTFAGEGVDYPLDVPEGHVFILNDFRSDLSDSRTYGLIPEEDVRGKLLFLLRRRNF